MSKGGLPNPLIRIATSAFVTVELSHPVRYSPRMILKSPLQHDPHLRNAQDYQRALHASALSSIAIESVKKNSNASVQQLNLQGGET